MCMYGLLRILDRCISIKVNLQICMISVAVLILSTKQIVELLYTGELHTCHSFDSDTVGTKFGLRKVIEVVCKPKECAPIVLNLSAFQETLILVK